MRESSQTTSAPSADPHASEALGARSGQPRAAQLASGGSSADLVLYAECARVLIRALGIRQGREPGSSREVRRALVASLEKLSTRCTRAGIAADDVAEARYALVAFIDEQVVQSSWVGRREWMSQPLQLELYRESTAGENFFLRLKSHLRAGRRRAIEVCHLCLAMGFTGAYGGAGDVEGLERYRRAAARVACPRSPEARLSPRARPRSRRGFAAGGVSPVLLLAAGASVAVGLALGGLAWAAESRLRDLTAAPSRGEGS